MEFAALIILVIFCSGLMGFAIGRSSLRAEQSKPLISDDGLFTCTPFLAVEESYLLDEARNAIELGYVSETEAAHTLTDYCMGRLAMTDAHRRVRGRPTQLRARARK